MVKAVMVVVSRGQRDSTGVQATMTLQFDHNGVDNDVISVALVKR